MFDVLIRNAEVIAGIRVPRYLADIGITGNRIDSIGDLSATEARQTIDASGLVAAPGFIDVHTHTDDILCGCVSPLQASDCDKSGVVKSPATAEPSAAAGDKPLEALRLEGRPHPRVFGSAGRVLGPLVREVKLFSLEDAVQKLSGYPANRFGLKQRGELKPGHFADVVVFDPETITDQATYLEPLRPTLGMHSVLVNGTPIIESGQPVPSERLPQILSGRYLRCGRA